MSDPKKEPTDVDLDDFLDLDFGNKSNTQAKADDGLGKPASPAETKPNSTPIADKPLTSKEELDLEFANSKAKTSTVLDFETTSDDPEPVTAPAPKPKGGLFGNKDKTLSNKADKKASKSKGGLFGKKDKAISTALDNGSTSAKTTKKTNPAIIGGVVALVLVVGLLFVLLGGDDAPAEPVAPPVASAPPTPPSPPPAETTPAPEAPSAPTDTPNATATTEPNMLPTTTAPNINPDEILKAEIPEDPALLKEEIDRLTDTEKQLDEQSKMIQEQLELMNDLTKAKDEEIALLEAQIAELEKQRAGK